MNDTFKQEKNSKAFEGLTTACEAIASGQFDAVDALYDVIADETIASEIRDLAESFSSMVVQVEAREFHANQLIDDLKETQRKLEATQRKLKSENTGLRAKLKKLDVTYDEEQADQEIEEIAESEYFQNLQARARQLRNKFKQD
ncbi:hypothetical protein [uncultured Cohaesibacter sp.]|uniref:hypothetical protein n=1 Tax=uncultured Cohaesibacter sp. TaxID=1002546 RepID=UPI0029C7DFB5|nr:hypothetical protein [uncultured Cohaesibacter sp.]